MRARHPLQATPLPPACSRGSNAIGRTVVMRLALAVVVLVSLAFAPSAGAVWGGQEDTAHPGVGAMYFDEDGDGAVTADWLVCTGSYAGRSKDGRSDVILMAG